MTKSHIGHWDLVIGHWDLKMKLIIQIPAYNEQDTLPGVLADLPAAIKGIDLIETLVIDDGSTDDTAAIAEQCGADYVVRHRGNKGLAAAFQTGLDACLRLGADIVVNTDGDGQYPGAAIPQLIAPILAGQADIVIGDRQIQSIVHFSARKRLLQRLGSWVVGLASGISIPDAPSGFRAYSREAALRLFVTSDFSYTLENLIQAGKRRLTIAHVPIHTNETPRKSKLHQGDWDFVKKQAATIVRSYASYEPLKTFFYLAVPFLLFGLLLIGRIGVLYLSGQVTRGSNVQSLIVGVASLIIGFLIVLFGILADRVGDNRRLLEEILYHVRAQRLANDQIPMTNDQIPNLSLSEAKDPKSQPLTHEYQVLNPRDDLFEI